MAEMMRIAGKAPNNTAKGIAVNGDGNVVHEKKWKNAYTKIANAIEIRNTTAVIVDGGSVEEYGMISLRVQNSHDKPITIGFYSDSAASGGSSTLATLGDNQTVEIPGGTSYHYIITANDIPFINYLRYIKLRVKAAEAPTSGSVTIYLHTKG